MPLLTLEGFEVPVVPGTRQNDEPFGDYARAYSSQMRSDRRAMNRVIPVAGSIFDTSDDAVALRAILNTPGKVLAGGTMIGDDAYFHVRNIQITPVTVDRSQFAFELHESDDAPSPILFSFDGDAPGSYTFTRSGTVGPYTSASGILRNAAANVARREYLWCDGTYTIATRPDTAAYVSEIARTNLVSSDNFDTGWTSSSAVAVTAVSDPAGGSLGYRIADDSAVDNEYKYLAVTFTGNAVKSLVFVVREATMASSGTQDLNVADTSAAAFRLVLAISSWTSGAPNVSAAVGTYLGKRYLGNGYWALYCQTTSVTAANNHVIEIRPAGTAGATGSIDVFRVNAYNAVVPGWSILDASETRAVDTWYAPFTHVPQAMTGFVDFVEGMVPGSYADERIMYIGNAAGTGGALSLYRTSGLDSFTALYHNGTASNTATVDISPSWGDRIRIRWALSSTGTLLVGAMKDSGAGFGSETVSATSAAPTGGLGRSFADTRLYLSHAGAPDIAAYINVKVVRGVQSMAYMTDIARARLHPRTADHGALFDMAASVSASLATVAAESP